MGETRQEMIEVDQVGEHGGSDQGRSDVDGAMQTFLRQTSEDLEIRNGCVEEEDVEDYFQTLGLHCWVNREQGVKTLCWGKSPC